MFRTLAATLKKWRASRNGGRQLIELLTHVEWQAPHGARHQWLIELVRWVRRGGLPDGKVDRRVSRPQHVRLRYLLRMLDQHPDWKRDVARLLRATLAEGDAISLLCDTGMPTRSGFWGALVERLQSSLIPPAPNTRSLSALVTLMFADADDGHVADEASWIDTIPAELLDALRNLLLYGMDDADTAARADERGAARRPRHEDEAEGGVTGAGGAGDFSHALLAAMHNLCYQIGSTGLSSAVRSRLSEARIQALPFYRLGPAMQSVEAAHAMREAQARESDVASRGVLDPTLEGAREGAAGRAEHMDAALRLLQEVNVLRALLDECHAAIRELYAHLDANGVSVEVVFQVERMRERLIRFERLLDAWMTTDDPASQAHLIADLIRATRARQSVGHLLRMNFALLARKMVESCAQTGGHYIARDRRQYRQMLWMASGGGAVTAVTVYFKFFITGSHMQPMVEGFLAGLNYAWSFVLMHFLHFTLATKQPAMTAPAIAQRLEAAGTPEGLEAFAAEVVALMRTQAAAIFGNLALVFPLCLLVQLAWFRLTGGHLITPEKARATLASFSLLGPTPLYAAMTGVLLWASSLLAGWAENWFALHRIGDVLNYNRRLRFVFGNAGAARVAHFWRHNFSGIVSNVALGLMLGLVPAVMTAFALPFEVRHVTLSTGSIAVALGVLGPKVLHESVLWWAVAGTAAMAMLNVAVSFTLAFQMALRSRTSLPVDKRDIYRSVGRRLLAHPLELLFPAAASKPGQGLSSREG
ncbi:site-specific recombinase [Robbsia sp. Bb-Pol-6]|uniref:Site-specific recombinase n=1 Tax=Robbsia betulipollinis TaxID=2981849 RepID=A0ABT3ZR84_9BURK|nr:site-specific recombinase [Robbsia betulipollinis]MCY0389056.1 site-specific recombinase [Robbsia betulipollinis]